MKQPQSFDVVVAGAGMAGLCASLAALEQGARVLIVEKGRRHGGSMLLAGGLVWTLDSVDRLAAHMPGGNEVLQELVINDLGASLDWLASQGVSAGPLEPHKSFGHGRRVVPGEVAPALVKRVRELGGEIWLGAPLIGLAGDSAGVAGVRVLHNGTADFVAAAGTILATGGFQGNTELVTRYITPSADRVYLRANPWSTGDGLTAATAVGAALTPWLDWFYGHALPAPPARFGPNQFYDLAQKYGQQAVALNLSGRRFADESAGTGEEVLNWAIARQERATAVYIIDAQTAERPSAVGPLPRVSIERASDCGGQVAHSDTLEDLCGHLEEWGFDGQTALLTLRAYNTSVACEGARLRPGRRANRNPLTKPPFRAVLVRPSITFTGGGLLTDPAMQVLSQFASASALPLTRADWSELQYAAIPNLFAAGADTGGVHAYGYMGGLATALVTGRQAGLSAAASLT
jgi:succinate dehydrogenase/fumarate reductase flavoprotein subunit